MSGASLPPERIPSLDFYTMAPGAAPGAEAYHMVMFPGTITPGMLANARKAARLGDEVRTTLYDDPLFGGRVDIHPPISGKDVQRFGESMARGLGASTIRSINMAEIDPEKRERIIPRQTTTTDTRHALLGLIRLVTSR